MANDNPNDSWHYPKSAFGKAWVGFWRKIYRPLGFQKGYNFPLFVICNGALFGFILSRFRYLDINGFLARATIPGEWFWDSTGYRRVGLVLHLATILPAGFLVCFQFVPVIRHKLLMFHRINGYVIMVLFFASIAGVLMITRRVVGGSPATQAAMGTLAAATTISISLAYYNIKRLQIDQHRAWMLRTWAYAASIISLRLIMMAANTVIESSGDYWNVIACDEIFNDYAVLGIPAKGNPAFQIHPQCASPKARNATGGYVVAHADSSLPENAGAMFGLTFGMATWMAFFIHAVAVEIYLNLTPAEGERLRNVSYERQVEAGYKNAGSAGLTVDRIGDAPTWRPSKYRDTNGETLEMSYGHRSSGDA